MADDARIYTVLDRIEKAVSRVAADLSTLRESAASREARLAAAELAVREGAMQRAAIEARLRDRETAGAASAKVERIDDAVSDLRERVGANAARIKILIAILSGGGLLGASAAGALKAWGG